MNVRATLMSRPQCLNHSVSCSPLMILPLGDLKEIKEADDKNHNQNQKFETSWSCWEQFIKT